MLKYADIPILEYNSLRKCFNLLVFIKLFPQDTVSFPRFNKLSPKDNMSFP